jgi:hypothetical protein
MKLSAQLRSTHDRDGAVILDILHGQMFRANLVGSEILKLLEQGCTEMQTVEELARQFGVSREVVQTDVREFLVQLDKHNLLELAPLEILAP